MHLLVRFDSVTIFIEVTFLLSFIIMTAVVATSAFVGPSDINQYHNMRSISDNDRTQQQQQQHTLIPSQVLLHRNTAKMKSTMSISNIQHLNMSPIEDLPNLKQQQHQHQQQLRSITTTQSLRTQLPMLQLAKPLQSSLKPEVSTEGTTVASVALISDVLVINNNDGNLKRGRRRNRTERKKRAAIAAKKASSGTTTNDLSSILASVANIPAETIAEQLNSDTKTTYCANESTAIVSNFPTSGNLPDIFWRAIPIEHLRDHPNFQALPEPSTIRILRTIDDVKNFRQDSWQWDTIHQGRCTTSQAVAALGFLESKAGEELDVPLSWRRGGMGAFVRLSVKPIRTLDEMNQLLIDATVSNNHTLTSSPWVKTSEQLDNNKVGRKMFAAQYTYRLSALQMQEQKKYSRKVSQNEQMSKSIRMMWGNTQEATSLLTAINYFTQNDSNFILEEVGMCGADIPLNVSSTSSTTTNSNIAGNTTNSKSISSSLLIGATPDGILRHSDGRIEVLEVKNHCPFFSNSNHGGGSGKGIKNKGGKRKRFTINSKPFDIDQGSNNYGVFAHYVPQLQLEMLCVGDECRSAVMIRQTATSGAIVLRMHRDDEWIQEMIYWLHRFQLDYVEAKKAPTKNFFYDSPNLTDRSRYRRFVNKTKEIRNSRVEFVALIPNHEIQRMGDNSSLFLD